MCGFVGSRWAIRVMSDQLVRVSQNCASTMDRAYRVYFVQRGAALVILLVGGAKGTQEQDIQIARELARKV